MSEHEKKDETPKKKRFLVRAVIKSYDTKNDPLEAHAENLERTLNELHEAGYEPQIMGEPDKGSIILLGVLRPSMGEHPLMALLRGHGEQEPSIPHKSEKTDDVLQILDAVDRKSSETASPEEVAEGAAQAAMKTLSVNDVPDIVEDLEAYAKAHAASPGHTGPEPKCTIYQTLTLFAKKLQEKAQAQLQ